MLRSSPNQTCACWPQSKAQHVAWVRATRAACLRDTLAASVKVSCGWSPCRCGPCASGGWGCSEQPWGPAELCWGWPCPCGSAGSSSCRHRSQPSSPPRSADSPPCCGPCRLTLCPPPFPAQHCDGAHLRMTSGCYHCAAPLMRHKESFLKKRSSARGYAKGLPS